MCDRRLADAHVADQNRRAGSAAVNARANAAANAIVRPSTKIWQYQTHGADFKTSSGNRKLGRRGSRYDPLWQKHVDEMLAMNSCSICPFADVLAKTAPRTADFCDTSCGCDAGLTGLQELPGPGSASNHDGRTGAEIGVSLLLVPWHPRHGSETPKRRAARSPGRRRRGSISHDVFRHIATGSRADRWSEPGYRRHCAWHVFQLPTHWIPACAVCEA